MCIWKGRADFMQENIETKENKMGVMPVNKLLISMALPIMISMLVQALYNIVDSMFVSIIGEEALTSVSLAFPVQNLMIAIGVGTGVGINALLSRCLGEKNKEEADLAANNGVFLALISYLLFLFFGLFFVNFYFLTQTSDSTILDYGHSYLSICSLGSFGLFFQITFERLLQSTGKTLYSMITQGLGAIINIILDPIMIFGLFGFPKMGVGGAALATVCGQIFASCLAIAFNLKINKELTFQGRGFRPNLNIILKIYSVGVPSIIMASIASIMTFCINQILMAFTPTATAVFGVYFKLQSFVFMPIFGLSNGMVPIVAYNYGARKKERIISTIRLSIFYAVGIMIIGLLIFQVFPQYLLMLFNASEEMLSIGIVSLRIISICFPFAGFSIVCSSVFQSFGNGILSLLLSIGRQLIVLIPVAFLLSKLGGLHALWWSFPISEIAALILCIFFLKHIYKTLILPLSLDQ